MNYDLNIIYIRVNQIKKALLKPISEQRKSTLTSELLVIKKEYKLGLNVRHLRSV